MPSDGFRTLLLMPTVSINRSDLFPIGTSVGVYPANAQRRGQVPQGPPTAQVIASGTVDAAGALSVTNAAILSYTDYVFYALVNGEHRYARCRSTADAHGSSVKYKQVGTSWPATVAARRSGAGTS